MEQVITLIANRKLVEARHGDISLPIVKGIALGDGGVDASGILIEPLNTSNQLNHELMRKDIGTSTRINDTTYRYRIDLTKSDLAGENISEAALYDADGDLLAIRVFLPKPKEDDMEMAFEIDDSFV